jgi:Something about silencing, SAS, complex subunit 4
LFQVVDFSSINRHTTHNDNSPDPLSDSVYFASHRRAERKEKQLRNIEKERAMHEKVQLERLLDGLQGPDWLRVMGITGVTDGEKKDWEPKRDYFVSEVRALVDKFRIWKEEEKRLKMEREAALLAREEEEAEEEGAEAEGDEEDEADMSPSSDIDAWAARQLQQEINSASSSAPKPRSRRRPISVLPPPLPEPLKLFTSFYSKPHLREAALGKNRHGRNVTAFGQPIPEFEEREFTLPSEYLTPDALRVHARKRRRLKRESGVNKNIKS